MAEEMIQISRVRGAVNSERGSVSLERVGLVLIAALLSAVVVLALAQATPLAPAVRRAICTIITLGQGSCGEATASDVKAEPADPPPRGWGLRLQLRTMTSVRSCPPQLAHRYRTPMAACGTCVMRLSLSPSPMP